MPKNITSKMIKKISNSIVDILDNTHGSKHSYYQTSIFYTKSLPIISLEDYIYRLVHYINPEVTSFCLSLVYLDRFCHLTGLSPCKEIIYRLYLICLIIAIKYNEDSCLSNKAYSNIGGISISDLNMLEKMFLKLIKYNLYVEEGLFEEYWSVLRLYI
jgi:hypothetical protein